MENLQAITWKVRIDPFEVIPDDSYAISRLIHAALVDKNFEYLLLNDPLTALTNGYNGESFVMEQDEQAFLSTIRASSLSDFADQWIKHKKISIEKYPHALSTKAMQRKEKAAPTHKKKHKPWVKPTLTVKKRQEWTEEEIQAVIDIRKKHNLSKENPDNQN